MTVVVAYERCVIRPEVHEDFVGYGHVVVDDPGSPKEGVPPISGEVRLGLVLGSNGNEPQPPCGEIGHEVRRFTSVDKVSRLRRDMLRMLRWRERGKAKDDQQQDSNADADYFRPLFGLICLACSLDARMLHHSGSMSSQ